MMPLLGHSAHNLCLASQSSSEFIVIPSFLQFYFGCLFPQEDSKPRFRLLSNADNGEETFFGRPS